MKVEDYLTDGNLDGEVVTLTNVAFERDPQYQDGERPYMTVDFVPDDEDTDPDTGKRMSLGTGWVENDDGDEIERDDGRKPKFHRRTKLGFMLNSLSGLPEFREAVANNNGVSPSQAAFWEGIRGELFTEQDSFEGGNGETVEVTYYGFKTYEGGGIGEGRGAKKTAKKAAKKVAKKVAKKTVAKKAAAKKAEEPEVEEEVEDSGSGADDEALETFRAALIEHCNNTETESHADWCLEAYADFEDELTSIPGAEELIDVPKKVWNEVWG